MAGNNKRHGKGWPMYGKPGSKNPRADYTPRPPKKEASA